MVASIYENSDNMPPAARKIWDTLLVDTDVIVYAFEETE